MGNVLSKKRNPRFVDLIGQPIEIKIPMKIIGIMGGPGVGKTTIASEVFSILKRRHLNVEKVDEFAKQLVYQKSYDLLKNQIYIFGMQQSMFYMLRNDIDLVVTDAPLLANVIYSDYYCGEDPLFNELVVREMKKFEHQIFVIQRETVYQEVGRYQKEDEAKKIDKAIIRTLERYEIPYRMVSINNAAQYIANKI